MVIIKWARVAAAIGLVALLIGAGGKARAAGAVTVTASVDGQQLGPSSQNQPVKLFPRQQSILAVRVKNNGSATVEVRTVQLEGQVIGLTFFAYDASVSFSVAPGTSASQSLVIDLSGLAGQATGLIPGTVKVLDANHEVLAQQDGVTDVRGSLRSVYGLFGLGIAFLTAMSFAGALIGLARHRLPVNRWRRGLRFLTPGLGLGLVVNFTLSATRVFVPGIGRWLTITALCAVIFFALGYLTPTPDLEDDQLEPAETEPGPGVSILAIAGRPAQSALGTQPAPWQLAGGAPPEPSLGSASPAAAIAPAPVPPPAPAAVAVAVPAPMPAEAPAPPPAPAAVAVAVPAPMPAEAPATTTPAASSPDPRATLPAGYTLPEPPPGSLGDPDDG